MRGGTCNLATGTWAVRPGPWDLGPGTSWNMAPVTWNPEPGIRYLGAASWDIGATLSICFFPK